ncbi:bifunctional YncE family protein/alkaline phosphatase family protein [Microbacterium mangrovi]|nr:bifunctional YncE family protein/alkaline phosphatase family protein [Microbacterium mangrovi]
MLVAAGAGCVVALVGGGIATASTLSFDDNQVGMEYAKGLQVSDNQILKPIGDRLVSTNGKLMGSSVSPDGRFLAASSADKSIALQIFDLQTYRLVWTVGTSSTANEKVSDGSVGQEGPTFSPDGKFVWLPQATGLSRFPVNGDGSLGAGVKVTIPTVNGAQALTGQTAYSPDGTTLYAAVNGQNSVVAIDPVTGSITKTWNVGIAPRELRFVGGKLYVSNEGGRTAVAGDTTLNSYGTQVPADGFLGTTTTGTVSVIDTANPSSDVASIGVGLHPTAMHLDGTRLYVANTGSDTVSVIDTASDKVVQTISTQPWSGSAVGYEPTGITVSGGRLLVTLGRANAVAVYSVDKDPRSPASLIGLLPTDYYPQSIANVDGKIVVTNMRGIDARGPELTFNKGPGTVSATGHGTHSTTGSLTRFTLPSDQEIVRDTATVFAQNGWTPGSVQQASGQRAAAVPVPARIGDPSTIKHVFLLVKENRTYDQVYGDMKQGNGDATLAQFGQKVTPNQHALATQFGLYDNTYDIGTNSAEGHNWLMQGDNPEYTESSAGEYTRSYDTEDDVLGHQRSGFLWTSVEKAGGTAKDFGEFTQFETKPATASWQNYYCTTKDVLAGGDPAQLTDPSILQDTSSPIPSLNQITNHAYPKFDTSIPDIYRYGIWKQDFEKNGPASLNMLWLSSDHTGGTADPEAQVADNDLAVGKIVDEISHSKYWKDSAIFVLEDDSQDGADHVDGHRSPVQVISPWAQHGKTVSTFYSQISVVRTIEQILGGQPLNQKVAAATPMFDAFTKKADLTPFSAVPNQVPLTEGVVTTPSCGLDTLGQTGAAAAKVNAAAQAAASVPASEKSVAKQWEKWAQKQDLTGNGAIPDEAAPALMNRWTWYQTHRWSTPYPGDSRILTPSQVKSSGSGTVDSDG